MVAIRSGRDSRTIVADADGRYEFTALPAGAYLVMADGGFERATHLTHVLGDPRPLESTIDLLNKTFMLEDGEIRGDADIPLTRAVAIDGRVIDSEGEPMTGVEVTASPAERRLADLASAYTDDRGLFRLYGLAPWAYRVCAEPKGGRSSYPRYPISSDSVGRLMKTCFPDAATTEDAKSVEVGRSLTPAVEIIIRTVHRVQGVRHDSGQCGSPRP